MLLKNKEKQNIPEGWKMLPIGSNVKLQGGNAFSVSNYVGEGIPPGEVVNSGGIINKYTQTLNEKGLAVSRLFPKGTIVHTIAANIGETCILKFDSCFPDSLVSITPKNGIDAVFLEYFLRTRKDYLNSIATQSAQKNINLQKLEPMLVIRPSLDEQTEIAGILISLDEKITVNNKLLAKLTKLKNGLMQDLLSGNKRVKI